MQPNAVFVFGTLKQGFPNFSHNVGTRLPGDYITAAAYPLWLVGARCSPWLVLTPGVGTQVHGQLFAVDESALQLMDRLERVTAADGYQRLCIEVIETHSQQRSLAWVYGKSARQAQAAAITLQIPDGIYRLEHAARYRARDGSCS